MTKLYFEPIDVECEDAEPCSFTWRRKAYRITAVPKHWIVRVDWWRQEIYRQYYQVECDNLGVYEIYCESLKTQRVPPGRQGASRWFLERLYD